MLDKIRKKLTSMFCKAQTELYYAKDNEQGDTNFISIAIVLMIVVTIAIAFIALKGKIMDKVESVVDNFLNMF